MKITNIKVGAIIFNKVNGKEYEVISMPSAQKGREYGEAVAFNVNTQLMYTSEEPEYDVVQFHEGNALCFRMLFVPEDKTVPQGYKVNNGILYTEEDEQVTEQGQIYIEQIIKALPGYLVLAVRPRVESEGQIDLFAYRPEKDEFKKLIRSSIPNPVEVLTPAGDSVVLGYTQTHMEDVLDDDGKPTGELTKRFDGCALILVKDCRVDSVFFDKPMDFTCVYDVHGATNRFIVGTNERVDYDGDVVYGDWYYDEIGVSDDTICVASHYTTKEPVTSAAVVRNGDGGIVLRGKNFIQYNDIRIESALVQKMPGPYLVDVAYEDHAVIVTMADEKYNTSRIKRQNTKDRGYIVSLI